MSKHIQVGMMVEVIDVELNANAKRYAGHVGKVLSKWDTHQRWGDRWDIEGTDVSNVCFSTRQLYPITPDEDASWDNEVWKKLGWQPHKETA